MSWTQRPCSLSIPSLCLHTASVKAETDNGYKESWKCSCLWSPCIPFIFLLLLVRQNLRFLPQAKTGSVQNLPLVIPLWSHLWLFMNLKNKTKMPSLQQNYRHPRRTLSHKWKSQLDINKNSASTLCSASHHALLPHKLFHSHFLPSTYLPHPPLCENPLWLLKKQSPGTLTVLQLEFSQF